MEKENKQSKNTSQEIEHDELDVYGHTNPCYIDCAPNPCYVHYERQPEYYNRCASGGATPYKCLCY